MAAQGDQSTPRKPRRSWCNSDDTLLVGAALAMGRAGVHRAAAVAVVEGCSIQRAPAQGWMGMPVDRQSCRKKVCSSKHAHLRIQLNCT